MATPKQQFANQANAQRSTGPKTDEGKTRSAANARKHGLCASNLLIADEDKEAYLTMASGFYSAIAPRNQVEETIFDELVAAAWNLRRARLLETEACADFDTFGAILDDEALQKKLERIARHKTRIERSFHRNLKTLQALQAAPVLDAGVATGPDEPISEQTQSAPEPPTDYASDAEQAAHMGEQTAYRAPRGQLQGSSR